MIVDVKIYHVSFFIFYFLFQSNLCLRVLGNLHFLNSFDNLGYNRVDGLKYSDFSSRLLLLFKNNVKYISCEG